MEIINQLNVPNNIIYCNEDDEDTFLFVHKPLRLDELPSIDASFINDKYLELETPKSMLDYFNNVLNSPERLRISLINGIQLNRNAYSGYVCDYCCTCIEDDWFYCLHCNKNMCKLCHEETTEEIAIANGSENYKKREDKLNKCRAFNQIEPRNIYNIITPIYGRMCDICEYDDINDFIIGFNDNFYSVTTDSGYNTFDICMDCYQKSDDVRNMVETKSMRLIDVNDKSNYFFYYTEFGSMLYWFPVISDTEGCHVFINLNPDDTNYGKICLQSSDDHGRRGYFIIRDEKYTLQKVLERLKEICDKGTFEYKDLEKVEDGVYGEEIVTSCGYGSRLIKRETIKEPKYEWVIKTAELYSQDNSSPIHILMKELNMPVYYG